MTAPITGMAHVGDVDEEGWILDPVRFADSPFARIWISGDSYLKTMHRAASSPARLPGHQHLGELWERVMESGSGLEVYAGWLVWAEPECGRCAPPYGCPPGAHMSPIRELTWLRPGS